MGVATGDDGVVRSVPMAIVLKGRVLTIALMLLLIQTKLILRGSKATTPKSTKSLKH